jgi:integrase
MYINFNLRVTKGTKPQPIYCIVRYGEKGNLKKVTINTELKINPQFWSSAKQKPKPTLGTTAEVNKIEKNLQKVAARVKKVLTSEDMSVKHFREAYHDKNYSATGTLFAVMDLMSRTRSVQYSNLKKVLVDYQEDKGVKLEFETITLDFYTLFLIWMREKGYTDSSIKTYIGYLKIIMRFGLKAGHHTNEHYTEFKPPKPTIHRYFIPEKEVLKLAEVDLPKDLEVVRDLFIIQCFTGLRTVDVLRLHNYIPKGNRLVFHMKKGKRDLHIVLIPPVMNIYKKYSFSFPKYERHEVLYYSQLKKVFKLSNVFNDKVEVRIGKDVFKMEPRYELFTPHTGRRSFATNAASRGVPLRAIMNQGGWNSLSQVQKYILHDNEGDIKSMENAYKDLNMVVNK